VAGTRGRHPSSSFGAGEMPCGSEWWAEVTARARSWSSDGSSALSSPPVTDPWPDSAAADSSFRGSPGCDSTDSEPPAPAPDAPDAVFPAPARSASGSSTSSSSAPRSSASGPHLSSEARSSAAGFEGSDDLVVRAVEVLSALALAELPDSPSTCLEQTQELLFARDRLISAISTRVGRVHRAGEVKAHGHAATRTWLQGACGTSAGSASHLVKLATELARLRVVRVRFAEGSLSEGQVSAICAATSGLSDEQAEIAESILVSLADRATPAEVAKAGRYLRQMLDPGQADKERDTDYAGRYLQVRPSGSGGMAGEFRLPREAAARLRTWLDAYAKPKTDDDDDRPLRVRNADALMALLEKKITTELLVLVNVESLPKDHPPDPASDPAGGPAGHRKDGPADGHSHGDAPPAADAGDPGETKPSGSAFGSSFGHTPGAAFGRVPGGGAAGGPGRVSGHGSEHGPGGEPGREPGPRAASGERQSGLSGLGWAMPGLLLATGQLLSPDDVARLARTSTLVRLVMDADGQVLDMGRTARLANWAQRRAVFARYATCWVDGCPLPATVCQIDHADNWTDGGMTDLRMLGPACQFHNRDRYRRPHRYERRPEGKDRWAFSRTGPRHTSRRPSPARAAPADAMNSTAAGARGPNAP